MEKNHGKNKVDKMMKKKNFFVVLWNACTILELMLCNQNLTKFVYQTMLSSDSRAWALQLCKHLKKTTKFSMKIKLKAEHEL